MNVETLNLTVEELQILHHNLTEIHDGNIDWIQGDRREPKPDYFEIAHAVDADGVTYRLLMLAH